MPDYVNQTDPTDQNADSTGCGMAFISWLLSQGITLESIAQGMVSLGDVGTLAQLYASLTGDVQSNALPAFAAAVQSLPGGVTSDDPFGGAVQPAQMAHIAPWTVALAGKVFAAILSDIAASKEPHQILASVRAALASRPPSRVGRLARSECAVGSRRLRPPQANR
jgi:hypothetical protein